MQNKSNNQYIHQFLSKIKDLGIWGREMIDMKMHQLTSINQQSTLN